MSFICDCGQVYRERAAVRGCQAANHSAAAGNELADAERFMRDCGLDPNAEAPVLDDCSRCKGARGGIPGNENMVDGALLCDYCHADDLPADKSK